MSSKVDVRAYNFLVHYGVNDQNNLQELLEEGLIDVFRSPPSIGSRVQYFRDVKIYPLGSGYAISGLMYKQGEVSWKSVPGENLEPIDDPGSKSILPYARFILTVPNHRLLWVTERQLSKSPSAIDFCRYIKRAILPGLRQHYRLLAEIEWAGAEEELREAGYVRKSEYMSAFLKENKINSKGLSIRVVPEVSLEKVAEVIARPELILTEARLYPHMNNVTAEDCEELFTRADKLAKEANSKAFVDLKPDNPKEGIGKAAITNVLAINDEKKLLRFDLTLKNKHRRDAKPLKLSSSDTSDTNIARSDVIEGDVRDPALVTEAVSRFSDIAENPGELADSLKKTLEEKLNKNE